MFDPHLLSHAWPYYLAALAGGYLLGSIPFGLVLTRAAGLGDIRAIGSGNIGATNVLRTGSKGLALATLLLDGGKGAAAVLLVRYFWGPDPAILAGAGAMLGHLFPVWLGFKGGKGVATTLGTLLAADFFVGLAACATWLAVAFALRYSSLAALISVAAAPLYAWFLPLLWAPGAETVGDARMAGFALFLAALVWLKHHANIRRLLDGSEPKIGRTKKDAPSQG
ncbi:MAG: glycerol-3-phosphate 1-O-acyltransferase PlsY [Tagaea sp.]|nr:glycerol-3-phosphate 1-O-acyltransferase PlsY [Tagaea sp.]